MMVPSTMVVMMTTTTSEDDDLINNISVVLNASNGTDPEHESKVNSYFFYETEQLTFLCIMFIFIVVGNSAVIIAMFISKSKKSRMNFFITQLAFADLSVGLFCVLTDIIWKVTVSWNAGNVACKIIRYLQVLVTYSSTYVLVSLSIDRYDAITHPMKFSGSWRRARILVASAWVLSALFSLPILGLYGEAYIEGQPQCWIDLGESWKWQLYMTLVSISLFIIPFIIISACYAIIVLTIWKKSNTLTPANPNNSDSSLRGFGAIMKQQKKLRKLRHNEGDVDSRRASSRGLIPKAKIKTVKMTFVIVFMFMLCWSPYIVYDLLQVYGHIEPSRTQNAIATFIQSMAPLNSAANPIIYCLFSTRICRNLRKIRLLSWVADKCCCCCPSPPEPRKVATTVYKGSEYTTMSESLSRSSRRSSSSTNRTVQQGNWVRPPRLSQRSCSTSSTSSNRTSVTLKRHVTATDSNASSAAAGSAVFLQRLNSANSSHNSIL